MNDPLVQLAGHPYFWLVCLPLLVGIYDFPLGVGAALLTALWVGHSYGTLMGWMYFGCGFLISFTAVLAKVSYEQKHNRRWYW